MPSHTSRRLFGGSRTLHRYFGEAVKATDGTVNSATTSHLAHSCTETTPKIIETIAWSISPTGEPQCTITKDGVPQCMITNVRGTAPAAARNLAGVERPIPVASFLDTKEREDPTWKSARKLFAPTFRMQVQVLKKKKLKEEGRPALYIMQKRRPQLLYTEQDRALMEEAWELTAAHREDLAGRQGTPPVTPSRSSSSSGSSRSSSRSVPATAAPRAPFWLAF